MQWCGRIKEIGDNFRFLCNLALRQVDALARPPSRAGSKKFGPSAWNVPPAPHNMYFELIIGLVLGVLCGIITGILPGIHVNLIATTLFSLSPILLQHFEPLSLGVFIISLSVVHSFLDTIPSVYLGAPENENALSVLPGQRMLLQGEAYQAVKITILGTYAGMIFSVMLFPVFLFVAPMVSEFIEPYVVFLLIVISVFMIIRDKLFWSSFLFLASGTLGILVFSVSNFPEPLFPMLSGLFGISGLIISYFENTKIPPQKTSKEIDLSVKKLLKALVGSSIGVFVIQFLPGLGPAQGAVISNQIVKDLKDKGYLALVGAMGTMSVVFSLVTFYSLDKAKDGTIVVISKLMEVDFVSFLVLMVVFVIAGSISVFLTLWLSKLFSKFIEKVDYQALIVCVVFFVFVLCFILNGPIGIVVLITSTAIGLIAPFKEISRSHAMGCLILPVILNFLL